MITLYILSSLCAVIFAAVDCPVPAAISTAAFLIIFAIKVHKQHIAPKLHHYRTHQV